MRINIKLTKDVEFPPLSVGDLSSLTPTVINEFMKEIKKTIKPYFPKDLIVVRKRDDGSVQFCEECDHKFKSRRAYLAHLSNNPNCKAENVYKKTQIFISSHFVRNETHLYFYITLENKNRDVNLSQKIFSKRYLLESVSRTVRKKIKSLY